MPLRRCVLLALTLTVLMPLAAQERQGNIVEYFGKEKIDEVSEGEILHLFNRGMILSGLPSSFALEPVRHDRLLASFVGRRDTTLLPQTAYDIPGEASVSWDTITINDRGEFTGDIRNGYLYLEYEAAREQDILLEASGHTTAIVNGMPHEGDHYDFGWSLIPVHLRKGHNFVVLSGGRFSRIRARFLKPDFPVQFTRRDLTLPDLLIGADEPAWGAVRIMNTQPGTFAGGSITARIAERSATYAVAPIVPLFVRKVPFQLPVAAAPQPDSSYLLTLELRDPRGELVDTLSVSVTAKTREQHRKETFVSAVDGSVQYYSIVPSLSGDAPGQALTLTVHGASVEAVNQANAYDRKDSMFIVAATNRRPFGFAWEDWGRRDAIEVLETAEQRYQTDPQRTYLTGHSMGGHGTWHIGVTYPDRFAAIGPAAGYPDLIGYRQSFMRRIAERPAEFFAELGMTREEFLDQMEGKQSSPTLQSIADNLLRAGNQSRTLKLKDNYLHYGVYILHGEKDNVVPTALAREMRALLGTYHDDFAYFEYPDGEHWFGDQSVDWPPLFEFFNFRKIKPDAEIDELSFTTASPGISPGSHYVEIWQQETPLDISSFTLDRASDTLKLGTRNVSLLRIDPAPLGDTLPHLYLDDQPMTFSKASEPAFFRRRGTDWTAADAPPATEKQPARYGTFKDAFSNGMVFVYASGGTAEENEWYLQRARYDAEKWYYRGNGSVPIVRDTDFRPADYPESNVILYGNHDNNAAWDQLLSHAPFDVTAGQLTFGDRQFQGADLGAYLVYPRRGTDASTIGVVTATGPEGMYAAYANDYFLDTTAFPDVLIFDGRMPRSGVSGVLGSGYFGHAWDIPGGDFVWQVAR
ncbi:alpha/beta fold hydrolase [Lewinella sp. IMCC34183]|uniref:alpha/beta fold hydrolase n=1 Tax=Lewinella sp. IMCC34183 TaxID=2248762 RepID=UPI000E22A83B|nr:alpha/beta fold hydrolase [Lewinella sp. IMCC34183]